MRRVDAERRPHLHPVRLALCVVLVATATLGLPAPARACGIVTHTLIVQRAIEMMTEENYPGLEANYPGLKELVTNQHQVVNYGAVFPDWSVMSNPDLGELPHDTGDLRANRAPAFRSALMGNLLSNFRRNPQTGWYGWSTAFLLGLISHQVSDIRYHDSGDAPCTTEPDGQCWMEGLQPLAARGGIMHWDLELHSDFLFSPPQYGVSWYSPSTALLATYRALDPNNVFGVTEDSLLDGKIAQTMQYYLEIGKGFIQYPQIGTYFDSLPWPVPTFIVFDHVFLETYPRGGVLDCAACTVEAWMETWDWLRNYTPVTVTTVSPERADTISGWYRQPVTIRGGGTSTHQGVAATGPFATYYSLDGGATYQPWDAPLVLSSPGIQRVAFYTTDSFGNAESVQRMTVRIAPPREPQPNRNR